MTGNVGSLPVKQAPRRGTPLVFAFLILLPLLAVLPLDAATAQSAVLTPRTGTTPRLKPSPMDNAILWGVTP